jgi:hypothetical protein
MPVVDFSADANDWQERVDNLKPDDPLFVSGGPDEWQSDALLSPMHPRDTWGKMILGYKQAADSLIQSAPSTQINFIVYPVLYLYRHHIELQLKYINQLGESMLSGPVPRHDEHDLMKLWQATKQILERLFPHDQDTEKIENIIRQIAEVDRRSFSFRYPYDHDHKPYLPDDLERINLLHIWEKMDAALGLLEGGATGLDEALSSMP